MAIVTPTDRPTSVRNRCVIEVFGGVFVLSRCLLDFSVGVGAFVIGLSQIAFFFSQNNTLIRQNTLSFIILALITVYILVSGVHVCNKVI